MADNRLYLQTQKFTLSASISLSDTSIALSSFNMPDGTAIVSGDLGTINFATLEPGTTREEQVTFTGLTGTTLTGVIRGIRFDSPYTQDTSLRVSHAAGSVLVLSNTVAFYDNFANKNNDETIVQTWTFTDSALPRTSNSATAPTADAEFAFKKYVDDTASGMPVTKDAEVIAGTAGETVAAGEIIYFDVTDKEWKLADASVAGTAENILLGIAQGAGTNGNAISGGILTSGLDTNQTGMTAGTKQFLSDTAGGISESAGTKEVSLGFSNSGSTTDLIFSPRFDQQLTEDQQDALAGNLGTPSTSDLYVTQTGFQKGAEVFAADAAGSDTYVITLSPVPTAYFTGMVINFSANTANTGAATINVNSLGAKTIKKLHDQDLETGDIESGQILTIVYDGTNFQMQSQIAQKTGNKILVNATAVSISSSTTETTLTTVSLAGGRLSTNNAVRIKILYTAFGLTDTQTFTIRLKYGSTTLVTQVITAAVVAGNTNPIDGYMEAYLVASGATGTQDGNVLFVGNASGGTLNETFQGDIDVAVGTATEDSTGALTLAITGQFNNSSVNDLITTQIAIMDIID